LEDNFTGFLAGANYLQVQVQLVAQVLEANADSPLVERFGALRSCRRPAHFRPAHAH
jgi:hypothetical protein